MTGKTTGKMTGKYLSAVLVCLLGINFLAGCSEKKTVEYDMSGNTENIQTEGAYGKLKQFADASVWQETWTVKDAEEKEVTLSVDSKISVPGAEQMSVVEVEEPEFDADYKETIAKQIFGGNEVYYNDPAHLPKEAIEERKDVCQEMYDNYCENDEEGKAQLQQEILGYEEAWKTAGDAYIPVVSYDVDEYIGELEGISYELTFWESSGVAKVENVYKSKEISLLPKDIHQVCPEGLSGGGYVCYGVGEEEVSAKNQCKLSGEEALETAQNFLGALRLEYPVLRSCKPLLWGGEPDVYDTENGYVFTFDAGIDQISFALFGGQNVYSNYSKKKEQEKGRYDLNAVLTVMVTDRGVIGMSAENPIEIDGVLEGTGLLPVEEIEGIIKDQVAKHFEDFRFEYTSSQKITFNKMELIYFRIRDKEDAGKFSYIPAWRLSERYSSSFEIYNQVLINAIDGSVIDFYDEI